MAIDQETIAQTPGMRILIGTKQPKIITHLTGVESR